VNERDKAVERLLRQSRQSLRADRDALVTDSCLDAETLAAWADGGLSGAALERAELHVGGCARCQALVGTFARLNSAIPPREPEHAARRWFAWLIPLTAAAVAVAVWMAVPGNQPEAVRDARVQQTTNMQREAESQPQRPAPGVDQFQAAAGGRKVEQPVQTPVPSATVSGTVAPELRRDEARPEVDSLSKKETVSTAAESPARAPAAGAAGAVGGAVAAGPSPTSAGALEANVRAKLLAETATIDIVSPDPMVRWRIAGSVVQHSTNGGAAWGATSTGVTAELTAGSAPSPSVCWVVGRGGVVLLAVDGSTWRRVPFPEPTDLSGVRARDARAASVTAADGRVFSTTDAGNNWVPRPLQDF
jgi:hypothetical protein